MKKVAIVIAGSNPCFNGISAELRYYDERKVQPYIVLILVLMEYQ